MKFYSNSAKQNFLSGLLFEIENRENDFPVVSDLSEIEKGYRGLVVEVNDHGNVTAYKCFKNGNLREIASRV